MNYNAPRYRACPNCGGTYFHTTQWRGLVERCVLYLWGLRPYQCRECYKRFYLRPVPGDESAAKAMRRSAIEAIPKRTQA